jgi:hypothetical protein
VKFWIPWGIDAVMASVVVGFFLVGLGDRSVSSYNIVLWMGLLAAVAVVVGGSLILKAVGQRALAIALALVLAIPAALFCLFWVVVIVSHPRWN